MLLRRRVLSSAARLPIVPVHSVRPVAAAIAPTVRWLATTTPPSSASTSTAPPPPTLSSSLFLTAEANPTWPVFGTKPSDHEAYQWQTYGEFADTVRQYATSLVALNVKPGDRVALVSRNSAAWAAVAYAAYSIGAVVVPMYEAQKPREWKYIIDDSTPSLVFVSTPELRTLLRDVGVPTDKVVVLAGPSLQRFASASKHAGALRMPPPPAGDDLATLVYTSGTTGTPKGVMLTHSNIMSNINGLQELFGHVFQPGHRSLCFLPWGHILGQTVELHWSIRMGAAMGFAASADRLVHNMAEVQPDAIVCVPLVLYRMYDGIQAAMQGSTVRSAIFKLALRAAAAKRRALDSGSTNPLPFLAYRLADAVVFSAIRARFGGNLKMAVVGGSATSVEVQQFFSYGATETSPIIATERLGPTEKMQGGLRRFPGTHLLLLDGEGNSLPFDGEAEGELLVAGPQVMRGYYNAPELDEAAFYVDADGTRYFRTGDLAKITKDTSLGPTVTQKDVIRITGRAKEAFKLDSGKFVSPAAVEDAMKTSPFIAQAFVTGKDHAHTVAIVVPDVGAVKTWLAEDGVAADWSDDTVLLPASYTAVYDLLRGEIDAATAREPRVKRYEVPEKFVVLLKEFSTDAGELTQKLSLKRRVVEEKYKDALDSLLT